MEARLGKSAASAHRARDPGAQRPGSSQRDERLIRLTAVELLERLLSTAQLIAVNKPLLGLRQPTGSGRTITVSATSMISVTGRSAR